MAYSNISMLYASAIINGWRTYESVPEHLKAEVKEILTSEGLGHLTGEPAEATEGTTGA